MSDRRNAIPQTVHPKIRRIFEYWLAIHPDSGIPGRQHFDPVDVPDLLPHIRLIDIVGDPPRFRVRVCGERVRDHFGIPQQGRFYDEMFPGFISRPSYRDFMAAIATRLPQVHRGHCELTPDKEFVPLERIVLPLAGDGETVDMILAVSLFGEATWHAGRPRAECGDA